MMDKWNSRPDALKNLLNPAFMSIVIASISKGYCEESDHGIDLPLLQLAVSLILNKSISKKLPKQKTTSMPGWINSNISLLIGFREKSDDLFTYLKEGIIWGGNHNILCINDESKICLLPDANPQFFKSIQSNRGLCEYYRTSVRMGRWFAVSGLPKTVLQIWEMLL